MPITPRHKSFALVLVAAVTLTGCGSAAAKGAAEAGNTPETSIGWPVTVDNCGTEVTFTEAPERVVTIKSTTTEMLLALGLGDRIVGSASSDGPLPEALSADIPPVLAEKLPSQEAVLEAAPDLIYAGWESNFSADAAGERDSLQKLGIDTYVAPAACKAPGYMPNPLTFEDVFSQVEEVGRIFGAEDAARDFVEAQKAELAAIKQRIRARQLCGTALVQQMPRMSGPA